MTGVKTTEYNRNIKIFFDKIDDFKVLAFNIKKKDLQKGDSDLTCIRTDNDFLLVDSDNRNNKKEEEYFN